MTGVAQPNTRSSKGRCKHAIFDDCSVVAKYRIMLRVNLLLVYLVTEIPLPNFIQSNLTVDVKYLIIVTSKPNAK